MTKSPMRYNNNIWYTFSFAIFIVVTLGSVNPTFAQNPAQAKYDEAMVNYEWGDYNEAMVVLEEFLAQYPINNLSYDAQYLLGQCYNRLERYDDAIFAFYTAAYKYPQSNRADDALYALAGNLYSQDYIPQALDAYEQLVKKYPWSRHAAYAQMCIGWLYGGMGDTEKANAELEKVALNYPDSPYVRTAKESLVLVQLGSGLVESPSGSLDRDISFRTSNLNKLPIVNFEIGTVSGGSFEAPVWLKFYPVGTYDPDGHIVSFEMDMDGDGKYDISEKTLSGGSYEFTIPGKYTTTLRVTDDKGGVTIKSKSFTISDPNKTYAELPKVYQQVEERKSTDVELDKKLDSIIEEYKYQGDELSADEERALVYQQVEKSKLKNVAIDEKLDSIIEGYKRQDVEPTNNSNEFDIVHKEPIQEGNKSENKTDTSLIFGVNLLKNGSFEKGPSVGSFKLFSKGNGIPGWKVTRATVDLVGNYFNSADGGNSLDLNGTSYGEIQQQFSTKKGKQYMLSFYLAGNPGGGPTVKKLLVTVGNKSEEYQFDITGKNVRKMGWEYHELIFTAKDISTILSFESNHNSGPAAAGPVIDNVKVVEIEAEEFVEEILTPKVIITDDSTVQLTADSYVYAYSYRNWNEANFGQSELLSVGWHSTGGEKRSYLKFDLPNISADDLISAQLKLFIKETVGNRSLNFGVHNVLESWEEGFGTFHSGQSEPIDSSGAIIWDYQPKFDDSVFAKFKLRKRRDKSIKVDITTLVKSWLINNSNYGLLLKPQGYLSGRVPTSIYEIYSKEYQDQSKHPIITLDIKK